MGYNKIKIVNFLHGHLDFCMKPQTKPYDVLSLQFLKENKMRKIVVASIISILLLIVWIGYLKYDTKNFMKELSHEPLKQVTRTEI